MTSVVREVACVGFIFVLLIATASSADPFEGSFSAAAFDFDLDDFDDGPITLNGSVVNEGGGAYTLSIGGFDLNLSRDDDLLSLDASSQQFGDTIFHEAHLISNASVGAVAFVAQDVYPGSAPFDYHATTGVFSNTSQSFTTAEIAGRYVLRSVFNDNIVPDTEFQERIQTVEISALSATQVEMRLFEPGTTNVQLTLAADLVGSRLVPTQPVPGTVFFDIAIGEGQFVIGVAGNDGLTGGGQYYDGSSTIGLASRVCSPGDTDADGDIDTGDITTAIINFTGAGGSGKTCEDGDTDDDGDVDTADLTYSITNFTGAMAGNAGVPDLVYDPATGNVTIDADGADLISFSLQSGPFNAADFSDLPAGLTDNIATQIGWTCFNLFSGLTGSADLGNILPAGLNQAALEAALTTASYGLALAGGGGGGRLDLIIPEPGTVVLIGLGAMALVRRRRAVRD